MGDPTLTGEQLARRAGMTPPQLAEAIDQASTRPQHGPNRAQRRAAAKRGQR